MSDIVAISGHMHAGKTELAKRLIARFGLRSVHFADGVRLFASYGDIPSTRENLQKIGHGVRDLFPDYWVNQALKDIKQFGGHRIVVDDMRYLNEYEAMRKLGAVLIRLDATDDTRWERFHTSSKFDPAITREQWDMAQEHRSETAMDDVEDWDLRIQTDNLTARQVAEIVERTFSKALEGKAA